MPSCGLAARWCRPKRSRGRWSGGWTEYRYRDIVLPFLQSMPCASTPISTFTPNTPGRRAGMRTWSISRCGRGARESRSWERATSRIPPGGRRSARSSCRPSRDSSACGPRSSARSRASSRPPATAPSASFWRSRSRPSTRRANGRERSTISSMPPLSRPRAASANASGRSAIFRRMAGRSSGSTPGTCWRSRSRAGRTPISFPPTCGRHGSPCWARSPASTRWRSAMAISRRTSSPSRRGFRPIRR